MSKFGSLLLVSFFDGAASARFNRSNWPMHLTLVPWFSAESADNKKLSLALHRAARQHLAFNIIIGEQKLFGPDKNVPVHIITSPEPKQLHELLVEEVEKAGYSIENKRWTGDRYQAHVTWYSYDHAEQGAELPLREFSLVRLIEGNNCEVLEDFKLKGTGI